MNEGGKLRAVVLALAGPSPELSYGLGLIFSNNDGIGRTVHVSQVGIVAIVKGCGRSPDQLIQGLETSSPGAIVYTPPKSAPRSG